MELKSLARPIMEPIVKAATKPTLRKAQLGSLASVLSQSSNMALRMIPETQFQNMNDATEQTASAIPLPIQSI